MNNEIMVLRVKRIEICDLMLACTHIFCGAREEMNDESTSEERKKILEGTFQKWKTLHDKLERQLDVQDKLVERLGELE